MAKPTIIQQSGALVYHFGPKGLRFGLITSRGRGRWVVPKGHIEDGMTPTQSAEWEVYEELGVRGEISDKVIGRFNYTKFDEPKHRIYELRLFPMLTTEILDNWPEMEECRRA